MSHLASIQAERLLRFNRDVLDQALALVAAHDGPGRPSFAAPVGPHLRHVIEHYEALLCGGDSAEIDYDSRPRDRELERSTSLASARVQALQQQLQRMSHADLNRPIAVRGQGGVAGDFAFEVASSLGRELVFVANHAIHHFALLQAHCERQGIPLGAGFGKAPATVAHERAASHIDHNSFSKESSCPAPLLAI